MFVEALAVTDIKLGDMMKHWQLTNHKNFNIHRTWNTLTVNSIGCLFKGIGDIIKDPINTCHFIIKKQVPDNHFRDVTYKKNQMHSTH